MQRSFAIFILLCGGLWVHLAQPGCAEPPGYYDGPFSKPPVSPYLNLGVNQNGLSNYQTLVRPMIEDRDAIMRESDALRQLRQQVRSRQGGTKDLQYRDADRSGGNKRYMNYSHYYSPIR